MSKSIKDLEADVHALHTALSNVLALFVAFDGWDYSCVDEALHALARNADRLPYRAAFEARIEAIRKEKEQS